MMIQEPQPRKYQQKSENPAEELAQYAPIYSYNRKDPIFYLDYGFNVDGFRDFVTGKDFSSLSPIYQTRSTDCQIRYGSFLWLVRSTLGVAVVSVTGEYIHSPVKPGLRTGKKKKQYPIIERICAVSSVNILCSYEYWQLPGKLLNVLERIQAENQYFFAITAVEEKAAIYSCCHDIYFIDSDLYLSCSFRNLQYEATDIADYLNAASSMLKLLADDESQKVFTKIKINSPAEITLCIGEILPELLNNWEIILIILIFTFGGKIEFPGKGYLEAHSLVETIKYLIDLCHQKKLEKLEIENKTIDLELKKLEYAEKMHKLEQEGVKVSKIAEKLNVRPTGMTTKMIGSITNRIQKKKNATVPDPKEENDS